MPRSRSGSILSMCFPNRTVVTRMAYGSDAIHTSRDRAGGHEVRPADHERTPGQEHAQLAETPPLQLIGGAT